MVSFKVNLSNSSHFAAHSVLITYVILSKRLDYIDGSSNYIFTV